MSMSATLKISNNTGGVIVFSNINKVNDDATWSITPPVGTKFKAGDSCLIGMGNASFFPKGVGCSANFIDSNLDVGNVTLEDPAVGSYNLSGSGDFTFEKSNPNGNSYEVVVK